MYIRKLELKNFRNYEALSIELKDGICLFVGENAQGKTNLLEACSLLSTARSHRTSRDKDMIAFDSEYAKAAVDCVERDGVHTVDIVISRNDKKRITVNGLPCRRVGEMIGQIKTVTFSPEDLDLVKCGPALRRRFMDIDLSQVQPLYFYSLSKYMKVLEQRNGLIKTFALGRGDTESLDVFDRMLSQCAVPVIKERQAFARRLSPVCSFVHYSLSGEKEKLEAEYISDCAPDEQRIYEQLRALRSIDIKRGTTGCGPHKDDIALKLNGTDLRYYGSQGQQRTAALALKLAQLELMKQDIGESPVLLLDDVMSELDPARQKQLLSFLEGLQSIVTTTHLLPEMKVSGAEVFKVASGTVTQE